MTLTDQLNRPFRDLRISVTDRCNFRCSYCMPADVFGEAYRFLPKDELLTFEEIARLARVFAGLGARKVRLTGGEPLIRKELDKLVALIAANPGLEDIALTTNGYFLPQQAEALRDAGLRRVTVSLDSLDNAVFRALNGGRADVGQVLAGIEAAERAGFAPIKINAVIKRGVNDGSVIDLARFCRERGYIARFIEYMDVGNLNGWRLDDVVPAREIVEMIDAQMPLEPVAPRYSGEVARRYRYRDGSGEIGVIASVTQRSAERAPGCGYPRWADIHLPVRHAWDGPARSAARGASDEELVAIVRNVVPADDRYSEVRACRRPARSED